MARVRGQVDALGRGKGGHGSKVRRSIKRQTGKLVRRLGKKLQEDAPTRVTRGYWD